MRVACPVLDLSATRHFFSDLNFKLVNCEKLRPEGCLKSYFEKINFYDYWTLVGAREHKYEKQQERSENTECRTFSTRFFQK